MRFCFLVRFGQEDEESHERAMARDALVRNYCQALPLVQQQLAAEQSKQQFVPVKRKGKL